MSDERIPRIHDSVQGSGAEFKVSFRILGTKLDFERLSSTLGLTPSRMHKAGETDILGEKFDRDMWSVESPLGRDAEFNEHIRWIKNAVGSQVNAVKQSSEDADLSLVCSYRTYDTDQGGFVLSPEALRICAEMGVRVEFHLLFI